MRLLKLILVLACLAVVGADAVLVSFGRGYLDREAERLDAVSADAVRRAARAASTEAVDNALEQLRVREDRRSWREYSYVYVPEGAEVLNKAFVLRLSPLRDLEPGGLVRARFTLDRGGALASPWRGPPADALAAALGEQGIEDDDPAERADKERRLDAIAAVREPLLYAARTTLPAPEILHDAATPQVLQCVAAPLELADDLRQAELGNTMVQRKLDLAWQTEQTVSRNFRGFQKRAYGEAQRQAQGSEAAPQRGGYEGYEQAGSAPGSGLPSVAPSTSSGSSVVGRLLEGLGLGRGDDPVPRQGAQTLPDAPPPQPGSSPGQAGPRGGLPPEDQAAAQRVEAQPEQQQPPQQQQPQQAAPGWQQGTSEALIAAHDAATVRVGPLSAVRVDDPRAPGGRRVFLMRSVSVEPWLLHAEPPAFQGFEIDVERVLATAREAVERQGLRVRRPALAADAAAATGAPAGGVGAAGQGSVASAPAASSLVIPLPHPVNDLALVVEAPPEAPGDPLRTPRLLLLGAGLLILGLGTGGPWLLYALIARRTELARRRTDFVAAVSHELKAPLAGIRALAEMMDGGLVTGEAKRAEYVAHILHESERLSRIIANVLDLAKLERHERGYHLRAVELGQVAREAAEAFRGHLERQKVSLQVEVAAGLPPVRGDRDALVQVVSNLIDNAAKYGTAGGPGEPAADGPPVVRVRAIALPDGGVAIEVEDGGPGIPAAERRDIFRAFYRGRRHLVGSAGGAGLGLAIVRRHMEGMGGTIALMPSPRGACFRLTLPPLPREEA